MGDALAGDLPQGRGDSRRAVNVETYGDRVRVFVENPSGSSYKLLSLDTESATGLATALIVSAEEIAGRRVGVTRKKG